MIEQGQLFFSVPSRKSMPTLTIGEDQKLAFLIGNETFWHSLEKMGPESSIFVSKRYKLLWLSKNVGFNQRLFAKTCQRFQGFLGNEVLRSQFKAIVDSSKRKPKVWHSVKSCHKNRTGKFDFCIEHKLLLRNPWFFSAAKLCCRFQSFLGTKMLRSQLKAIASNSYTKSVEKSSVWQSENDAFRFGAVSERILPIFCITQNRN